MAQVRGEIIQGNPSYTTVAANPPAQTPMGPQVQELTPSRQEDNFAPEYGSNNKLITRDRHGYIGRGSERTGRDPGTNDPLASGPARPSFKVLNRTFNHQVGSDATANTDDKTRAYNRDASGRLIGQQDGSIQPIYGGVPGLWIPYGSYSGYTQGPTKGIQSPAEYGAPDDQPRKIPAGPPHGLHTATFPDYSNTIGRYMATPQQTGARVDRPSNSRIAGQSYSQTVTPQGQTGTNAVQVQNGNPRQVGFKPGGGWRGA